MTKWSNVLLVTCLLAAAALLGCTGGCQPKPSISQTDDSDATCARVRLLAGVSHVTLTRRVRPRRCLTRRLENRSASTCLRGEPVELSFDGNGWLIGNRALIRRHRSMVAPGDRGLAYKVGGAVLPRPVHASFPSGTDQIDVINDLEVEAYLKGVLSRELLPDWHPGRLPGPSGHRTHLRAI